MVGCVILNGCASFITVASSSFTVRSATIRPTLATTAGAGHAGSPKGHTRRFGLMAFLPYRVTYVKRSLGARELTLRALIGGRLQPQDGSDANRYLMGNSLSRVRGDWRFRNGRRGGFGNDRPHCVGRRTFPI